MHVGLIYEAPIVFSPLLVGEQKIRFRTITLQCNTFHRTLNQKNPDALVLKPGLMY